MSELDWFLASSKPACGDTLKPLQIVCSSTRQWNPGDEWIACGIRRLFRALYPERPLNWILYDRAPDCFVEPWTAPDRKPNLLANSLQPRDGCLIPDLLVIAGTPEWLGPHVQTLACLHRAHPSPVFYLGIDYPSSDLPCTPDDLHMLSQALILTRGTLATQSLRALGFQPRRLPCPALFAAPIEYPARSLESIAVVLQSDTGGLHAISPDLKTRMLHLLPHLASRFRVKIVCNYIDEFLEFSRSLDLPVCYSYDAADYCGILADCDLVISTRLHSALLANSLLKPAIVTNNGARITSAVEACPYIYVREPEEVPAFLNSFAVEAPARDLLNWKRIQEAEYLHLLRGALQKHGLY